MALFYFPEPQAFRGVQILLRGSRIQRIDVWSVDGYYKEGIQRAGVSAKPNRTSIVTVTAYIKVPHPTLHFREMRFAV